MIWAIMTMLKSKAFTGGFRSAVLVILAGLALHLGACGFTAPRNNEGFADLESLGMFDTDRVMNLSIGPMLLHFAARYIDDDPDDCDEDTNVDGVPDDCCTDNAFCHDDDPCNFDR